VNLIHAEIYSINRSSAPLPNETIKDDMDIEGLLKLFKTYKVYSRSKEECPFHRGNWVIDFFTPDNSTIPGFCVKLPAYMTEEEVLKWLEPLKNRMTH